MFDPILIVEEQVTVELSAEVDDPILLVAEVVGWSSPC